MVFNGRAGTEGWVGEGERKEEERRREEGRGGRGRMEGVACERRVIPTPAWLVSSYQ